MIRWMKLALKLSHTSSHYKHKMAAVVIRGGTVISCATNTNIWGDHAELRALLGKKEKNVRGGVIIIARSNKRCSKPCRRCFEIIKKVGIRKMIYINKNCEVEVVRV